MQKRITLASLSLCIFVTIQAEETRAHRKLREITQEYQQTIERRKRLVSELKNLLQQTSLHMHTIQTELNALVGDLAYVEQQKSKKHMISLVRKVCVRLKDIRTASGIEGDQVALTLGQIEDLLSKEEQLLTQAHEVRMLLASNPVHEREVLFESDESRCSFGFKSILTFAAGAGLIAFLHWRKWITLPQV